MEMYKAMIVGFSVASIVFLLYVVGIAARQERKNRRNQT